MSQDPGNAVRQNPATIANGAAARCGRRPPRMYPASVAAAIRSAYTTNMPRWEKDGSVPAAETAIPAAMSIPATPIAHTGTRTGSAMASRVREGACPKTLPLRRRALSHAPLAAHAAAANGIV
ncbi:hypothetical protein ABZ957_21940 [Streptomyces sp. NPDC046316]|uniref:acyl-CoA-like ligand-binding transcription factor n=1 Tax=unclassified Streptomyces TaxID=2593676 RepID=UPI0034017D7D